MRTVFATALIFCVFLFETANAEYVKSDPINNTDPTGKMSCASNPACDPKSFYQSIPTDLVRILARSDMHQAIATPILAPVAAVGAAAVVSCATGGCSGAVVLAGEAAMGDAAIGTSLGASVATGGIRIADDVGELASDVVSNVTRFFKKQPAGSTGVDVDVLGDGVIATSEVPGRVPGSKAVYQKTIGADGKTTGMTKTTFDPDENVVHNKDKY